MKKSKRSFRWGKIVIIAVVAFCAFRMVGRVQQYSALKEDVGYWNAQLDIAQAEYDAKEETLDLLDDPAYIERLARENLGMVKEGETPVIVVKTKTAADKPEEADIAENDGDVDDAASHDAAEE